MEVIFKLKKIDLMKFNVYHSLSSPLNIIILILISGVFGFTRLYMFDTEEAKIIQLISFVLTIILWDLFYLIFILIAFMLGMTSKNNKIHFAETKFILNDDCLIKESEYGNSSSKWSVIRKIKKTKNYCFVYVAQNNAHIIPKDIFESSEKYEEFISFIEDKFVKCVKET